MATANKSHAFIGRGKIYMAAVIDGVMQSEFWVGVAKEQEFSHEVEDRKELKEWHTEHNQVWDSVAGGKKTTMTMSISERRPEALKAVLQASQKSVASAIVGDEEHKVANIGDTFALNNPKVGNVTIVDSAGTSLVEGTDYKIDKTYGRIEILSDPATAGYTSPLKVSYDYGEVTEHLPMTDSVDYYRVRTEGLNIAGQKGQHLVVVPHYELDPADAYKLINDDFDDMQVTGTCLYDEDMAGTYKIVNL